MSLWILAAIFGVALFLIRRFYIVGAKSTVKRDLYNNIVIITGSSSGIGKETARALARSNATIIFACRNQQKTQAVIDEISKDTGNSNLEFMPLDLEDLRSVKEFVKTFKNKYGMLHMLINNAGILGPRYRRVTRDKVEGQFQTNYLAPFYLTNLLLDSLKKAESARIIHVSSFGHIQGKFNWDDLMFEKNYDMNAAYGQSKLAVIAFIKTLQRKLKGTNVKAVSVNPGFVRTDGFRFVQEDPKIKLAFKIGWPLLQYFAKNSEEGAQTSIYCALEDFEKLEEGAYYSDCKPHNVNPEASKEDNQRKLWEVSEKLLREKLGEEIWEQEVVEVTE